MASPVMLTVKQLRNVLQLPERPFEDPYIYDGTSFYDFSHREICTLFSVSGMASGSPNLFRVGVDFQITSGVLDWRLPGVKPDLNTLFTIDYTYSRLGGDTASTSVWNGTLITAQDLGSSYPYASMTPQGQAYNDLATFLAALVAAREACYSLSTTEIDIAQKSRRGSVIIDDNKKTADWQSSAQDFNTRYKQYLTMVRPGGMIRSSLVIGQGYDRSVLGWLGSAVFDNTDVAAPYLDDEGVLY